MRSRREGDFVRRLLGVVPLTAGLVSVYVVVESVWAASQRHEYAEDLSRTWGWYAAIIVAGTYAAVGGASSLRRPRKSEGRRPSDGTD
jgi:hypothetical protein